MEVEIYGGLSFAAREQSTDRAIVAGLCGASPNAVTPWSRRNQRVEVDGACSWADGSVAHQPERDLRFVVNHSVAFDGNAIRFIARDAAGEPIASRVYFSSGNGAILAEGDVDRGTGPRVPYPFGSAESLLHFCRVRGKKIADIALANECALRSPAEVRSGLLRVAHAMLAALQRGLLTHGSLPGGSLRCAGAGRRHDGRGGADGSRCSIYAMAVAEENAAGGRVASAPSNGAAGPVAALLQNWRDSRPIEAEAGTSNSSDGGRDRSVAAVRRVNHVGCQSEVGVACAMAAAGYAAATERNTQVPTPPSVA